MSEDREGQEHHALRQRRLRARIEAKQVAAELDINSAALSRFELYGVPLPHAITGQDYADLLDRLTKSFDVDEYVADQVDAKHTRSENRS